jgi:CRP/FNR family transcriptional regulator
VVALEEVNVWSIPAEVFLGLIEKYPALAMAVIRHLSQRVLHYIGLVEDLSLRNVEARLASTLLQHAEARNGHLIVPRRGWTTFDEMAVRLGTVRDVLSRGLKTLEAEGLLKVEKQAILLLDPKGLMERGRL